MRKLVLCMLLAVLSTASYGQFVLSNRIWDGIDSLGRVVGRDQTWSPTSEKAQNVWRFVWESQLPSDTVRLRPNQYFDIFIDRGTLRVKLLNVTGVGNYRQSNFSAQWLSSVWVNKDTATTRLYCKPVGTAFPVNLQNGGATVEEKSLQVVVREASKYFCNDSVYVTLRVYDAEVANEGQLVINGNILQLFQNVPNTNDQIFVDWTMATPKAWWLEGVNNLKFVHTSTGGFKVDTMWLDMKSQWYQKDSVWNLDTLHLPYTNFGEADLCGNVRTPSDSLHKGKTEVYYFHWNKTYLSCPNIWQSSDSVHERLTIAPITIGGAGSTTMVYLRVTHSEIPFMYVPVPLQVEALPVRKSYYTGG